MITQSIELQVENTEHATLMHAELMRQAVEELTARGWKRDDFDHFLAELLEE